jgi:hypothetical protein
MSNVTKMVGFAAGAVMLAGTLLIGFRYYNMAKSYSESVRERAAVTLQEKEDYFLTRYEGLSPSGADVIKYIKTNIDRVETITVTTDKRTFTADVSQFSSYQVSTSEYYINPLKTYEITVNRSGNGVVTSVSIRVN